MAGVADAVDTADDSQDDPQAVQNAVETASVPPPKPGEAGFEPMAKPPVPGGTPAPAVSLAGTALAPASPIPPGQIANDIATARQKELAASGARQAASAAIAEGGKQRQEAFNKFTLLGGPPAPPDMSDSKPTPAPTYTPDTPLQDFGSFATVLGIMGGMLTRAPMTASLNAAASAMEAYHSRNLENYKIAVNQWQNQSEYLGKVMQWRTNAYDMALKKYEGDAGQLKTQLGIIAATTNDANMQAALAGNDATAWHSLAQDEINTTFKYQDQQLKLKEFFLNQAKSADDPGVMMTEEDQRRKAAGQPPMTTEEKKAFVVDLYKSRYTPGAQRWNSQQDLYNEAKNQLLAEKEAKGLPATLTAEEDGALRRWSMTKFSTQTPPLARWDPLTKSFVDVAGTNLPTVGGAPAPTQNQPPAPNAAPTPAAPAPSNAAPNAASAPSASASAGPPSLTTLSPGTDLTLGTGIASWFTHHFFTGLDAAGLPPGERLQAVDQSKTALRNLQVSTETALATAAGGNKPSTYLLKQFSELTVDPDKVIQGDQGALNKFRNIYQILNQKIAENDRVMAPGSGQYAQKDVLAARAQNNKLMDLRDTYADVIRRFDQMVKPPAIDPAAFDRKK